MIDKIINQFTTMEHEEQADTQRQPHVPLNLVEKPPSGNCARLEEPGKSVQPYINP